MQVFSCTNELLDGGARKCPYKLETAAGPSLEKTSPARRPSQRVNAMTTLNIDELPEPVKIPQPEAEFYTDRQLCQRWQCSIPTLWRIRRDDPRMPQPIKGFSARNITPGAEVRAYEQLLIAERDARVAAGNPLPQCGRHRGEAKDPRKRRPRGTQPIGPGR